MGNQLITAGEFLIKTLFDLYIMAVMLRFLLQLVRADFFNPLSQFLVTATNPTLVPMRRFVPGYAGIDLAAVVLMLALELAKFSCLYLFLYQTTPNFLGMLVLSVASLLQTVCHIYFFMIIIQAVLSWITPGSYNPMVGILVQLTEPVLRRARKWLPPIGGLDISPLLVLIGLQLLEILLVDPMMGFAHLLTSGIYR